MCILGLQACGNLGYQLRSFGTCRSKSGLDCQRKVTIKDKERQYRAPRSTSAGVVRIVSAKDTILHLCPGHDLGKTQDPAQTGCTRSRPTENCESLIIQSLLCGVGPCKSLTLRLASNCLSAQKTQRVASLQLLFRRAERGQ